MTRLLLVAATSAEIQPTINYLVENWESYNPAPQSTVAPESKPSAPAHYRYGQIQVDLLITAVGLPATAFAMGHVLALSQYDLAIQAGIAGAINKDLSLGQVVQISSERFADLGAETAEGGFIGLQSMGFLPTGPGSPFGFDGRILQAVNDEVQLPELAVCQAISVNKVHGEEKSINAVKKLYPQAEVESMEGASFFYACRMRGQTCIQLRGISNYVEARNRENWEIGLAVTKLNEVLLQLIQAYMATR